MNEQYVPYSVQYEVEYEDRPSDNDLCVIYARSADEAKGIFHSSFSHSLLSEYDNPTAITANAVWPN
jgi:hypothetical protein